MGKRVLSGLLALLMCVSLGGAVLPQTAKAEDMLDWKVLWQNDTGLFGDEAWGICCAYENAVLTAKYVGDDMLMSAILYEFDGTDLVPLLKGYFPWHGQSRTAGECIISDDGYFVIWLPEYQKNVVADYKGNVVLSDYDYINNIISDEGWVICDNLVVDHPGYEDDVHETSAVNLVTGETIALPENLSPDSYSDGVFSDEHFASCRYLDGDGNFLFDDKYVGTVFEHGYAFALEKDAPNPSYSEYNLVIDAKGNPVLRLGEEYFFDWEVRMTDSGIFRVGHPRGKYGLPDTVGYMNLKGEWILKPGTAKYGGEFHNGYVPIYTEEGFTVMDENGTFLIEPGSIEATDDKAFGVGLASNVTDAGLLWVQLSTYEGDYCVLVDLDGQENNPWYDGSGSQGNTETKPDPKHSASSVPAPAVPADPSAVAAESYNAGQQDYDAWTDTDKSYLYEREDGCLTRVEAVDDSVVVEVYSPDFELLTTSSVSMELPLFGAFYHGSEYNYILFGQNNMEESKSAEVYRLVKYSKDWERLGAASLYGAFTRRPFDAGRASIAEYGGYLYVRTCHEMFTTWDGFNHQANVTFNVRISDMAVTDSFTDIWNEENGYVSHSFAQYIAVDEDGTIVAMDHGDAGPRGLFLTRYNKKAGQDKFIDYNVKGAVIQDFADNANYNITGASLGGLVISDTHYLAAYNMDSQNGRTNTRRNVFVAAEGKSNMGGKADSVVQLSNYSANGDVSASTPHIVELSRDLFLVVWEEKDMATYKSPSTIGYAYVDGSGKQVGQTKTMPGRLSDCQPIVVDGNAVWYVTDNSKPVFYVLGDKGVRTTRVLGNEPQFIDVGENNWAFSFVQRAYANGAVNGTGDGNYNSGGEVTLAQFAAMLGNVAYNGEVADKTMTNWYNRQVEVLQEHGVLQGVDSSNMDAPATRYVMAQMVYNLIKDFGETLPDASVLSAAQAEILDWDQIPQQYRTAVSTCYAMKIFAGVKDVGFAGDRAITRDAMAAMYCNMADVLEAL